MITFENVTKQYIGGAVAVDRLSLVAPTGKLTVLVGPSGCGKTTSLRMVNRLITPSSGTISLDGEPTARMDVALLRRRIGYVIQHAGLFPHRTIVQNIATTALLNGIKPAKARTIALELIERVGLTLDFADRYPWQLSGGQQQRVGVARALASDPQFMLMDEPFSAVDPVVRLQLQDEFLRLQREIGKTIIMVTHDIDEALKLGDQVAVFRTGGELVQVAAPQELLTRPANAFVADFVGRDRGYRSLGFTPMGHNLPLRPEPTLRLGESVQAGGPLADERWVLVVDAVGKPLGWVDTANLRGPVQASDLNLSGTLAPVDGTLRQLFDATLSAPGRRGVVVGLDGLLLGTVSLSDVAAALGAPQGARDRSLS
ncbi:glycine/betaine ABC transporter ATP-binding protein [Pseudomonas gingeri NCPPB 3146 = LMG 5327]|uniref:ATP-binding cassette domain-containing protein n=3 Tax=Pseudomonas gingeri TaxID=117681 RepID=A0A7Y8CBK4_9PSED|nr:MULTISPECIES: ATP-binding cassette domain-containing protein [Pseudomonas]NVZ60507.1 ATP-binding cassette domain-containing protein [Pseudomonas gingeri]NWA08774.1 ATP-binding cassette domain-containing protein [Pseudomonas gingeri]NWC12718.1 ATP-binding cassette domain-containing protein [Pseudomonas gingeri]NWE49481.1 ATP-binding cassette domain-containing protein [Pseudomonas gingeri]NWE72985.1 ATP-binding cassette domain-containing protein [Pseudomonas gingeri]